MPLFLKHVLFHFCWDSDFPFFIRVSFVCMGVRRASEGAYCVKNGTEREQNVIGRVVFGVGWVVC